MAIARALKRYFRALETEERFSGVVLITQEGLPLFAGAYGYASRAWQVKATLATRFDTASITKLSTAVAVLQLVDEGLLTLDTSAIDYLGLQGTTISRDVTVHHLLTHSSGIADDADEEAGERYEDLWKTRPNYAVTETADFLPQFAHKPPNFPPGQGCRYCNCGYVLLGLLVERASRMPYRDYVRRKVFATTGMTNSDFCRMDQVQQNVAEGSDPLHDGTGRICGWKRNIYSFPPVGSPDGGAHVTATDLDRFLRAVKAGEILSSELTAAFFTPQVSHHDREGGSGHFGYGLWFLVDPAGHVVYCEKDGINPGVSGVIRHYPAEDINVVLLSNMETGAWDPLRHIHELLTAGAPS